MRLLVIRHGVAADKDEFARTGEPDELRPLTNEGKLKMEKVASGLRVIAPDIDVLASSGLVRADQTAKIVAKEYGGMKVELVTALRPDTKPSALLPWLEKQDDEDVVAIVGHESHLSETVTYMLTERTRPILGIGKGGACMLEFSSGLKAGTADLVWLMEPKQLRKLAE